MCPISVCFALIMSIYLRHYVKLLPDGQLPQYHGHTIFFLDIAIQVITIVSVTYTRTQGVRVVHYSLCTLNMLTMLHVFNLCPKMYQMYSAIQDISAEILKFKFTEFMYRSL